MNESNGQRSPLEVVFERVATALAKINTALSALHAICAHHFEFSREASARREREFEALRQALVELERAAALIDERIRETRSDVRDLTPVNGVKLPSPDEWKAMEVTGDGLRIRLTWDRVLPVARWALVAAGSAAAGWLAQWWANG